MTSATEDEPLPRTAGSVSSSGYESSARTRRSEDLRQKPRKAPPTPTSIISSGEWGMSLLSRPREPEQFGYFSVYTKSFSKMSPIVSRHDQRNVEHTVFQKFHFYGQSIDRYHISMVELPISNNRAGVYCYHPLTRIISYVVIYYAN